MLKKGRKVNIDYVSTNIAIIFLMFLLVFWVYIESMDFVGIYKMSYKWIYISSQKVIFKKFLLRYILLDFVFLIGFIAFCIWYTTNKKAYINSLLASFIKNNNYVVYETINGRKKLKNKVNIYFDYQKKKDYLIIRIFPNGSQFDRNLKDTAREKIEDLFATSISNMNMDYNLIQLEIAFNTDDRLTSIKYVDNGIMLDKKRVWDYDKVPHCVIAGTTGTGKTYFLNYIICNLLYQKCKITFIDPKWADVRAIGQVVNPTKTASDENNIAKLVREFKESMEERQKIIASTGRTNITYKDCGLKPEFLIFDELSAFKSLASKGSKTSKSGKESTNDNVKEAIKDVEAYLKRIILMGRSTGNFIILVAQQPNSDIIETGIRDQLGLKVTFGNTKEELKRMLFGTEIKLHTLDSRVKGVGYMSLSNAEPYKYYAPDLGSDFDYVREIKKFL